MPELPDIEVFSRNLKSMFAGKKLLKVNIVNAKKLKDSPAEYSKSLNGKKLTDVYRSGKELRFAFDDGILLGLHLMLTGDIFPFEKKNEHKFTIAEFHFEGGTGLTLTDRMRNANIKLNPEDKAGIDALSKELNFKYLKQVFQRKASIKNILLNQDIIRGIGNGYSDEILWETRISPYSIAEAIPDEKIKELVKNIKKILKDSTEEIYKAYPGITSGEIKEFLKIHTRKKDKSPTGATILIDQQGSRKTYYTEEQVLYT